MLLCSCANDYFLLITGLDIYHSSEDGYPSAAPTRTLTNGNVWNSVWNGGAEKGWGWRLEVGGELSDGG